MRIVEMRRGTWVLSICLLVAVLGPWLDGADAQSLADYVPGAVRAQSFELSIRNIMRAEENVGRAPTQIRWTDALRIRARRRSDGQRTHSHGPASGRGWSPVRDVDLWAVGYARHQPRGAGE